MAYQKITHESYGSRVVSSFKGILVGIILLIIGKVLLFWNEGRAVKTRDTINEAGAAAVEMPDITRVDHSFEGQLVYATGPADTNDTLTDSLFGASANAVSLERKVEYYQWVETSEKESVKKVGGGTETTTTYHYNEKWVEKPIESSSFENVAGHINTTLARMENETLMAPNVTFGAYSIPEFMKTSIGKAEALQLIVPQETLDTINKQVLAGLTSTEADQNYVSVQSNVVYIGISPTNPKVGDVRISFTQKKPGQISLLAVVKDDTFTEFISSNHQSFYLLQNGTVTLEGMLQSAEQGNVIITWILRAVGTILIMVGIGLIFAPLGTLADVIPVLGNIIGAGTGLVAILLGLAWSFIVAAVAWLRYRPLLGGGLLAAAILLIVLLSIRGRGRKKRLATTTGLAQGTPIAQPVQFAKAGSTHNTFGSTQPAAPGSSSDRRFCINCGASQSPGVRFCANCGASLE